MKPLAYLSKTGAAFALIFTFLTCFSTRSVAQFETSIGLLSPAVSDGARDGIQLSANEYLTLSNSVMSGRNCMILTKLNGSGVATSRMTLFSFAAHGHHYEAAEFEQVRINAVAQNAIYVTGRRYNPDLSGNTMFVARFRLSPLGQLDWVRSFTNNSYGAGVSLEVQSNGDVIVVGKGEGRIAAARVTSTGVLVWAKRYTDTAAGYVLNASGSCNGLFGANIPVVAITGIRQTNGVPAQAFVMLINAATGNRYWTTYHQSIWPECTGADLVQDPVTRRYHVTGSAGNRLWMMQIDGTTGLAPGENYGASYAVGENETLAGTSICLNRAKTRVIVSGYYNFTLFGQPMSKPFLAQFPLSPNVAPDWMRYYAAGDHMVKTRVSLRPITNPFEGYFLTSNYKAGEGLVGVHPILVRFTGLHNLPNCPVQNIQPARRVKLTSATFQVATTNAGLATSYAFDRKGFNAETFSCAGGLLAADDRESSDDVGEVFFEKENDLVVYPNPSTVGRAFNVIFASEQGQNAVLSLYDLTGKAVFEKNLTTDNQSTAVEIETDGLAAGVYFLKISTPEGQKTARLVLGKK